MNGYFTIAILQILFSVVFLLLISIPVIASATDTLKVCAIGVDNRVIVGKYTTVDTTVGIIGSHVQGSIRQKGINNSVRINEDKTDTCCLGIKKTNNSTSTSSNKKAATGSHTISVQQIGRNNSVNINNR